jgi:pyruvate kinase
MSSGYNMTNPNGAANGHANGATSSGPAADSFYMAELRRRAEIVLHAGDETKRLIQVSAYQRSSPIHSAKRNQELYTRYEYLSEEYTQVCDQRKSELEAAQQKEKALIAHMHTMKFSLVRHTGECFPFALRRGGAHVNLAR